MNAFPCDFRVGSTGFGLIGGIGAGVGFLTPLQLGGIPAFGQIAGALVGSLSRVDSALGHPTHKVRQCHVHCVHRIVMPCGPEVFLCPGERPDTRVSSQRP